MDPLARLAGGHGRCGPAVFTLRLAVAKRFIAVLLAWAASAAPAWAHESATLPGRGFEIATAVALTAAAGLYLIGLRHLRRHAGAGRGIRARHIASFVLGWLAVAIALLTPLDALAARSFAAHMAQHELLMVVAAPLLVLGRPLAVWVWALPRAARGAMRRGFDVISALAVMPVAWTLHAGALWLWHAPAFYELALVHPAVHVLQHVSFLVTAVLFWWAVLAAARRRVGLAAIALLSTLIHTGMLGALLTFAPRVWYAPYLHGMPDALADQQLGGLLMWVPGGVIYLLAALALVAQGLRPSAVAAAVADGAALVKD